MKLTTHQEDYIYSMLQALEKQYNGTIKELAEITAVSEETFKEFTKDMAEMVLDGTINENMLLKLSTQQQKHYIERIQEEIKNNINKEYELQKQMIEDELLTQGMNYEAYKQITLNGSVTMRPMKDMGKYLEIVNKKVNGLDWSERLWNSKKHTVKELNKAIKDLGKGYATMSEVKKRVRQTQNTSTYNVNRLVRNELCRVQSEVNEKFDKENEIEYQLFMAKMDNRTSCICKELDGKTFRTDDPKKPIPPNGTHIQCRSVLTGIPHKDWRPKNRRDKRDGKNEIIPYTTWEKENAIKVKNKKVITKGEEVKNNFINKHIPEEYHETINNQLAGARPKEVKLLEKFEEKIKFEDMNYKSGAFFSPSGNYIKLDIKEVANESGREQPFSTLWHELGHLIDCNAEKESNWGLLTERVGKSYLKALENDMVNFKDKMKALLLAEDKDRKIYTDTIQKYIRYHSEYKDVAPAISDTLHGASGGTYHMGYGHFSRGYWNKKNKANRVGEAFANMFQIFINGTKKDVEQLKEIFPTGVEEYEKIIDMILEEKE